MKYRLYVSGFCNETRNYESNMGIGGVILNDNGYEKVFSKEIGKGSIIEAHIHGIIYGINEAIKAEKISDLTVYSTNLMIINYLKMKNVEVPRKIEDLIDKILKESEKLKITINYEYFEANEYKYVRNLAEEAIKI
ncbi:ribonuclease H family protein [Clostridium sp. AL.422]|uniref:ribonuclease H family protein n=1 Tax=Clostridium TaxID=1485 RepID=UPI00293DE3D2|nr:MULTISPECIES: ribonuclease H family protein [unclassified Clostridium]MDV4152698.1 ribonuclease H family protein [Clostridium sp. AL.422]